MCVCCVFVKRSTTQRVRDPSGVKISWEAKHITHQHLTLNMYTIKKTKRINGPVFYSAKSRPQAPCYHGELA